MTPAVLAAIISAALFAIGSSLQHRAAGSSPGASKREMVASLLGRPSWLIGGALCAAAFLLHATALTLGDITIVQPIILTGIVFAVLVRPVLDHRRPPLREIGWAVLAWSGLAMFVFTVSPGRPASPNDINALLLLGVVLAVAVVLMLVGRAHRGRPVLRGAALAAAAGALYGLVAGLVKLTTTELPTRGIAAALLSWPPWTLAAVGGCAVLTNQRAYQSTRLSVTTPVLNVMQLLVSMCFGMVVFGEQPFRASSGHALQAIGLLVLVIAVIGLSLRATGEGSPTDDQPIGERRDEHDAAPIRPPTRTD